MAEAPKVDQEEETREVKVRGIDHPLYFPKSMSNQEIEDAIKIHPGYKPTGEGIPKSTTRQSLENIAGFTNEVGKGIPVAGHYIPRSTFAEQFSRNHPNYAMGARMTGGAASMVPLMMATGGMSLPGQVAASMAIGGVAGAADKVAQQHHEGKGYDTADIIKAGGLSSGMSAIGPVANRAITPTTLRPFTAGDTTDAAARGAANLNRAPTRSVGGEDLVEAARQGINTVPRTNPPSHWSTDLMTNSLAGSIGGEAIGSHFGLAPGTGATIGLGLGLSHDQIRNALLRSPWATNRLLLGPGKESILKALAASGTSSIPPHGLDKLQLLEQQGQQ